MLWKVRNVDFWPLLGAWIGDELQYNFGVVGYSALIKAL